MKLQTLAILLLLVAASCSSPKYVYNFRLHSYDGGKKMTVQQEVSAIADKTPEQFSASTTDVPVNFQKVVPLEVTKDYSAFEKPEQKSFKKETKLIKTAVKQAKKMESKSVKATSGWDRDLKMAAIFGAIGLGLGLLYTASSIIGFIGFAAIVIALVFLIRWLLRQ